MGRGDRGSAIGVDSGGGRGDRRGLERDRHGACGCNAAFRSSAQAKFIHKYIGDEAVPLRKLLFALGVVVAPDFDQGEAEAILRVLKAAITRVLRQRDKLETVNTPEDVIQLIRRSRKILVLTGAGVSTSAGLPDFRSADGIYARIESSDGFQLSDPRAYDLCRMLELTCDRGDVRH